MKSVRTDRSYWRDLILWLVLSQVCSLVVAGLFALIGLALPFTARAVMSIISGIISLLISLAYVIYVIYYYTKLTEDLNTVCEHTSGTAEDNSFSYIWVYLLNIVTIGLYGRYWYYKHGGRLYEAEKAYGIRTQENGMAYLVWMLLCPVVAQYLLIKNLNKACTKYAMGAKPVVGGEGGGKTPPPPPPPVTPDTIPEPTVNGLRGEYAGQKIKLAPGDRLTMGRDGARANLVFSSDKISRLHCEIEFSAGDNSFYVTDYSQNGILLNGRNKLPSGVRTRVKRGTTITLSESEEFDLR